MGVIVSSTPPRKVRVAGAPVSTRGLISALSIITLLVFVLPTGLAVWVNQRRMSRAEALVQRLATELSAESGRSSLSRAGADGVGLLAGPGDPMAGAADDMWRSTRTAPLGSYFLPGMEITPDPWARALIVNLGRAGAGPAWVLSPGPNGIIETPFAFRDAAHASGDDIAIPVR
jgi:hypothetical protein